VCVCVCVCVCVLCVCVYCEQSQICVILLRYGWLSGILSAVGDIRSLNVKTNLRELSYMYIASSLDNNILSRVISNVTAL